MTLFFVGILEMAIITLWTKWVAETKVLASGLITVANIMIWYYVLQTIIDDINNWNLALLYALGCALGTMISVYLSQSPKLKKIFACFFPAKAEMAE